MQGFPRVLESVRWYYGASFDTNSEGRAINTYMAKHCEMAPSQKECQGRGNPKM